MCTLAEIVDRLERGVRYNGWAYFPKYRLNLYYRITHRAIEGKMLASIDLATIEVDDGFRGQGLFTQFLVEVEKLAVEYNRVVFVESILNPKLLDFLKNQNYRVVSEMCAVK